MTAATLRGFTIGPGGAASLLTGSNLWDAPQLRTNDSDMPSSHGSLAGADRLGARLVTVAAQIVEATKAAALARWLELAAAWAPSDVDLELAYTDDSGDYLLVGRPRQARPFMANLAAGIIEAECRFAATNPFILSAAEHTADTSAPTPAVGRTYPRLYSWHYGPPGTGGSMSATNAGTAPAGWRASIVGPCSEPRLVGPDGTVAYGGSLAAGETLELDSRARSVLLQGTASRFALLTDFRWWTLPPGTSEVQFSTADNGGHVFLSWRDTWW